MGSNQAKSIAVSKAYGHLPVIHSNYFQNFIHSQTLTRMITQSYFYPKQPSAGILLTNVLQNFAKFT